MQRTKLSSRNQTVVPSKIRHELDIEPGDILEWRVKKNQIILSSRKPVDLKDIYGIMSYGGDAVKDKKKVWTGEL